MDINTTLIEYGLTDKEAKIYRFLIEKTESTAPAIAKATGIPRATAYLALDKLVTKNLISTTKRNNVTRFTCESLSRLKKLALDKVSLADLLIPQLRDLVHSEKNAPAAKLYVGTEGLKIVFESMLEEFKDKNIKQLHSITDSNIIKVLPKFFPDWVKRREKLGVFTAMIAENEKGEFPFKTNAQREVRFLPEDISFDCSINIFGDKIACYSLREKETYCIVVESPTVAHTMRQLFQTIWRFLGKTQ